MQGYYRAKRESDENHTTPAHYTIKNGSNKTTTTGTLLNGTLTGKSVWYYDTGTIECCSFFKNGIKHGECMYYNEDGDTIFHHFNINNEHIEELDYLINEERNEAFYVTLALYGIDKEYTICAE